jgi:hypothetical protein
MSVNVSLRGTVGELGAGLGQLNCTEPTERNGCMIGLDSEQGVGGAFIFSLPPM